MEPLKEPAVHHFNLGWREEWHNPNLIMKKNPNSQWDTFSKHLSNPENCQGHHKQGTSEETPQPKDALSTNRGVMSIKGHVGSQVASWTEMTVLLLFFSCSFMSDSLQPSGLQPTRFPCPSLSTRVCSNSSPLSQWCHPTISSSVIPFSSCLQSFPASGSFPMSWLFASGNQSTGASASASVLPMTT